MICLRSSEIVCLKNSWLTTFQNTKLRQSSSPHPYTFPFLENISFKVTVQFKTEENGQNEIVSHVDRSDETQNEILKQKNFTGSGIEGTPKLLESFFSRLFLCQNYEALEVPTRAEFRPLIWNLAVYS